MTQNTKQMFWKRFWKRVLIVYSLFALVQRKEEKCAKSE